MHYSEMEYILRNEKYYRNIVNLHFLESGAGDNLGVQNNSYGNSTEKNLLYKFNDEEYKKASKIINSIEKFRKQATEIELHIYNYKYIEGLSIPQIARRISYSESTVKKKNKIIKRKLYNLLKSV